MSKENIFLHLKTLLNDNGTIFGTTILGKGVSHNFIDRKLMQKYNEKGIFGNVNDTREDLETILEKHFYNYDIRVVGCVAFFTARK